MSAASLFTPLAAGKLTLKHRVTFSALTRTRMSAGAETPREINAVYYEQRASDGGLLVSECMAVSQGGRGYVRAPGLYKEGQAEAWKPIVERVHKKGATFFAQIFHAGRVSHSDLVGGKLPVAPSALGMAGQLYVEGGIKKDYEVPRALETDEIPGIVQEFASAAKAVITAGFDGVEIHAGNGYLLQQFLALKTNQRTDKYGGSLENRSRLLLEVLDACSAEIGADRVAVKLQPGITFSDLIEPEEDVGAQIDYLAKPLAARKLAYVDLSTLNGMPYCQLLGLSGPNISFDPFRRFRQAGYDGTLMINGALKGETAAAYVADGTADLASFGGPFISNANLPALLKAGKPLDMGFYDVTKWYSKNPADDEKGYIDWPLVEA